MTDILSYFSVYKYYDYLLVKTALFCFKSLKNISPMSEEV